MDNFFEIKYCNDGVIIKKNGISFSVEKGPDGDIWFNSLDSNIELPISYYSRNQDEFQSYIIFEYFMKSNDEINTTNANGKMVSRLLMSVSQNEIERN